MLQLAYAGYTLVSDQGVDTVFVDEPVYREPGFTQLSPLRISGTLGNSAFFLLRRRSDHTGDFFDNIHPDNFFVEATDEFTGNEINYEINFINSGWPVYDDKALIIIITPVSSVSAPKNILLTVGDNEDNLLVARLSLGVNSGSVGYLPLNNKEIYVRRKTSQYARNMILTIYDHGANVILSPFATFEESNQNDSDFSYPMGKIYYKIINKFGDDEFSFKLGSVSHSFLRDVVSVISLPQNRRIGIIMIDDKVVRDIGSLLSIPFIDIDILGEKSKSSVSFRMYLRKERWSGVVLKS